MLIIDFHRLMILESANGNQEAAIEILLGMSDPNYKPDPSSFAAPPPPTMVRHGQGGIHDPDLTAPCCRLKKSWMSNLQGV